MVKQEIAELKKQLTQNNCSLTRICGCYVDGEKNKKTEFGQAFLSLPEEEMFKYFELLRKTLSGALGKNLLNLEFPLEAEEKGGTQDFLLKLRNSRLEDGALLEAFYDRIIETYEYVGNYLILAVHAVYDVPGRASDGTDMEDASDEIYEYLLACICPVNLSKPGLSYYPAENSFRNRIRDWVVDAPQTGFLFPAFNDRSADIHSLLYYTRDSEELNGSFVSQFLSCPLPLSAGGQKETFQALVEDTLGDACELEAVKNIHDRLQEMIEEHKEEPEPLTLCKNDVKTLFAGSGVADEKLTGFDRAFDETAGEQTALLASNLVNARSFEVKSPDVVVKVRPERTDLLGTRILDGRKCLVIELNGDVEVNGILVKK